MNARMLSPFALRLLSRAALIFTTGAAFAATGTTPQPLPYVITAVAGGGTAGSATAPYVAGAVCATGSTLTASDAAGDGCLATQVLLSVPRAVAVDSQNNIFLVDSSNASIRRVDSRSGIITTVAGGGAATAAAGTSCATGSSLTSTSAFGDGCLATQVKLAAPEGLTLDPAGNIWFTDYTLGSVREVTKATGIISTIVNTAGTLGYRAGNIANPGTVVLAGAGQLVHPYGLAFDRQGNLYIADNYNSVVDVVNLSASTATIATIAVPAGAIYTIAGTGCAYGNSTTGCTTYGKTGNGGASTAATLDSPYQVAVDNSGNIYIADEYPYDVRVINGSTGILTTFANGSFTKSAAIVRGPAVSTSLASTYGVATDSFGNVYVAVYDATTSSSYIDRVDIATGIIYPIAGQVVTAAPSAAGVAPAGAIYCTGKTDNIGDGCPATQASLYKPFQPFVDAAGNVYIADQGNNLIRKVSAGTQFPAATTGTARTQTVDLHFGANDTPKATAPYTLQAGFPAYTLGTATCLLNAADMTTDCTLPVTYTPSAPGVQTDSITVLTTSGVTTSVALSGTGIAAALAIDPGVQATLASTGVTAVSGVTLDGAGNVYATVPGATTLTRISSTGTASTLGTGLSQSTGVAEDASGNLYIAQAGGTIVEIPSNSAQTTIGTGFTKPSGVATDSYGNVYVSDSAANTVSVILAGLGVQRTLGTATSAGLSGPAGLAVDAAGNVFVANTIANTVVELPFSGAAAITLGSGLLAPLSVATDAAGSVYVADSRNGRVVFLPNENGTINTADQIAVVTGLTSPSGVAVAPTGTLYVSDNSTNAIYTFTRTSAAIAFGNDPIGTQLTAPGDLTSVGNLAVTFGSGYTGTGNTTDFAVPTTGPSTLAPGFGSTFTTGFKPTATGARKAVYTVGSSNVTAPTLTLSGTGITPVNATTTTITATPLTGTYGQTVTATFTVAVGAGLPSPTGTVNVKVDTTSYTPTLNNGTVSLTLTGLGAGTHTITASYPGDTNSSPSTATPVTVTLAKAPLTVVVNNATKGYLAPIPTLTGTITGTVNNDSIGVTYTTTATATSPLGTYPITAVVTGTAAANYTATITPATLTITKATTTVTLGASSTAVSNSTVVTLTATVVPQNGGVPTGSVTFYNGTVAIGSAITVSNTGVATTTTTFAVVGQSTTNAITAVYTGDTNFGGSTSTVLNIVSSLPGFNLLNTPTAATVAQGQTALLSFTVTPTFGYAGAISFSCTGLPATVGCVFGPTSITATGTNASNLVALSITTSQPGQLAQNQPARISPIAFAILPGFALLLGLATRRRKLFRMRALLMAALLGMLAMQASGCAAAKLNVGTAVGGPYAITVAASGASGTSSISQQFVVNLTVTK